MRPPSHPVPRRAHLVIPHLMRNPEIPAGALAKYIPFTSPFWTPHRVRGDTKCSFFSAARRTNQEAPPLLSGRGGRRLRHRRGLRNSLRSDSPRPLSFSGLPAPCPIKAGFCGSSIFSPHSSLSVIFLSAFSHRPVYPRLSSSAMNWTPHRVRGDTVLDAVSRNIRKSVPVAIPLMS